ncbi:MAG: endonuclease/exonuclease/phosphatase family protein, partial [Candidatus Saccharimonadales bacterium]
MKLLQLNIWGGKLRYQITDYLSALGAEQPDFMCMQEVHDLKGISGALFATLDEIKKAGSFSEAFMSPAYAFRYMEREVGFGNATLSKLPFAATETIFTRGTYKQNFDVTKDDYNTRNFQLATVTINNVDVHILNHHAQHVPGTKKGDDEISRQMRMIADTIDTLEGPVILCGDFNLAPSSPSLAIINDKLSNLSTRYRLKSTYSQLSNQNEVCDYIFVNDLVKVRSFEMLE